MTYKTTKLIRQLLFVAALYFCCLNLSAQATYAVLKNSGKYNSFNLFISDNKSSTFVFPSEIQEIISPSSELKATLLEANNKVLDIVATTDKFKETSLFVLTQDGNKYSFVLNYSKKPSHLIYTIQDVTLGELQNHNQEKDFQLEADMALLQNEAANYKANFYKSLLLKPREIKIFSSKKNKAYLSLENIFILKGEFYLIVKIKNKNKLDYSLKGFRAFLKSRKTKKSRTLVTSNSIDIIDIYPSTGTIPSGGELRCLIILPKLSLGQDKFLSIESFELSDDRNLNIEINLNALKNVKKIIL